MDGVYIAELVLFSGYNGDLSICRLCLESDALCFACSSGYGKDVIIACQGDDCTLWGTDIDAGGGRSDLRWMVNGHGSGHLREECQEGIAVGGKHLIGDGFVLGVVWPVALGEEIFARHIAECRSPVAFVIGVRTIGGHELRVVLVVHAPYVCIVDERIRGLGGSYATHGTSVLSVAGAAHESLNEAFRIVVESAGLAVNSVDEGHLTNVVHLGHMTGAEIGLAPALVITMVTMLQQHATSVDSSHHLSCCAACPSAKFAWGCGNVPCPIRAKVVDHSRSVLCTRPAVARIT